MESSGGEALIASLHLVAVSAWLAVAQEPAEPADRAIAGPWESIRALQEARFQRAGRAPVRLFVVALGEIALGSAAAVYLEDPTAGAIGIAGGVAHAGLAVFAFESNIRRKKAFRAKIDAIDPSRPGALSALAESLRRSAEGAARWHTFTLGASMALPVAGVLSEGLDCIGLFGTGCETEPVVALGVVGLVGGIHSASRWRATSRVAGDLALVDQGIPTLLP